MPLHLLTIVAIEQAMMLYDEGTVGGVTSTSWQNGINLSACAEKWHRKNGGRQQHIFTAIHR